MLINLLLILFGIILTQTAILNYKFSDRAQGYMLRAAGSIWPFFICVFVIETIVAAALAELGSKFIPLPRPLLSLLAAIMTVLVPNTFEYFVLFRNVSEKKLKMNPLVKAIKKLNLAIVHTFGGAIRTCMQQDVYDIQAGRVLGLEIKETNRRIRQIYACHAQEIAKKQKKPELVRRDAGFWPAEHLYLLLEHLGKKRLIYEISNPPPLDWDGEEKRRLRSGTKADRRNPDDQTSLPSRYYDKDEQTRLIGDGRH